MLADDEIVERLNVLDYVGWQRGVVSKEQDEELRLRKHTTGSTKNAFQSRGVGAEIVRRVKSTETKEESRYVLMRLFCCC